MTPRAIPPRSSADVAAPEVRLRVPAFRDSIPILRRAARDFAVQNGAGDLVSADVALAVSEAVTNAVRYAYPAEGDGDVELQATVEKGGRLSVAVRDEGAGFRAGPSQGLGAGLVLIGECADMLKVDQGTDGVVVRMVFRLP